MLRSVRRGFTLVELMVVVAVVGVGGTLAVVNMSEQVAEARAKANGQAMLQRIRQEHRVNKERMMGMLLHARSDVLASSTPVGGSGGSGGSKNVLVFQDARDCVAFGKPREVTFYASTSLDIEGNGKMCWNEHGEPDPGRPREGGPTLNNNAGGDLQQGPRPISAPMVNAMTVKAGIKTIVSLPVQVTLAGVNSLPGKTGTGRLNGVTGENAPDVELPQ